MLVDFPARVSLNFEDIDSPKTILTCLCHPSISELQKRGSADPQRSHLYSCQLQSFPGKTRYDLYFVFSYHDDEKYLTDLRLRVPVDDDVAKIQELIY
ncbi:hypothetical protein A0H81_06693 [Grifola frondosa]|uniref:Uncharacterized protein n=1 Tax=Grifola frondosa TaxID=5627 RepID=A0A1C7M967_GRIFR|nr:hypothetical protein A0H81_06693 [Grifola frondosa]